MFDKIHSLWLGMNFGIASWNEEDQILALLCLGIGIIALLLWLGAQKWECLRNVVSAAQVAGAGDACRTRMPQRLGDDRCLVLEWVVRQRLGSSNIGDIGELEQRLLKLQSLNLDSAYHIVVSLSADQGVLSPRMMEILGRRFPGYTFVREEDGWGVCV